MFASLVLAVNRTVPAPTLIEQMWPEHAPRRARPALHTVVLRLRHNLSHAAIRTTHGGYQLTADEDTIDLYRFRRLVRSATTTSPDIDESLALLREACALWRGRPFFDVSSGWLERDIVPFLTEEWFAANERRIDLELGSGRHLELVPELRALANRYPGREATWHRLMTALHRTGRRVEALEAYQQLRTIMDREFGLQPSAELQRLQRVILLAEPDPTAVAEQPVPP